MSLFSTPEEHAANPPSTWKVVGGAGNWHIQSQDGYTLERFTTKHDALAALESGHAVRLYSQEARWYAGEPVANWKPWVVVQAERERYARRSAS